MRVLVLNCGSSSVKFRLFDMATQTRMAGGIVERIGSDEAALNYRIPGRSELRETVQARDHRQAIHLVITTLSDPDRGVLDDIHGIDAIGHRVVHGGETFTQPALIDEAVLIKIKACQQLAPLHNPPNISGIEASLSLIPFARQIAVFDTAFHQTMEPEAFVYALPYEWYEQRMIRRYGFHGTSHCYVSRRAAGLLGKPIEDLKIITCHLGNGASLCAVKGGKSIDTSMGFTPVEGLVMGTRCGDIDASIPLHVMAEDGLSSDQMGTILNKRSGLFGITGGDNDLRTIEEKAAAGSERYKLALRIFTRKVRKYIGAYAAVLGGLDCLVFTAGIGENSPIVRDMICRGLQFLGVELDQAANRRNDESIGKGNTEVLVLATDEELAIAQEVTSVLAQETPGDESPRVTPREHTSGMVLTVDDDPDVQDFLETVLRSAGYECSRAGTMKEAIRMVPEVSPDIIILDIMMEDISAGFRFARELRLSETRAGRRPIPILVLSSVEKVTDLKFRDRVGTDDLPVDGFLGKPVRPEVLLERVKSTIEQTIRP